MKYTKYILSIILALALCVSLFACKEDIPDDPADSVEESESTTDNTDTNVPPTGTEDDDNSLEIDIPTKAGGVDYKSVYDAFDNTTMLYFEGVNADGANGYGDSLVADGYSLYVTTDNASVWSATYKKGDVSVHVYYLKALSEFRVLRSEKANLPNTYAESERVCDISITQLGKDAATPTEGMGYIIQLEDGTFVVIDGGHNGNADPGALYQKLLGMKRAEAEKIVVRAWFITHMDVEHYGALMSYFGTYENELSIEMIVANDAPDAVYKALGASAGGLSLSKFEGFFGGAKYVKAHTGQKFSFAGLEMNVLYTHEDANALETSSMHSRAALVFDAVFGEERMIWLGDIEKDGADRLVKMYGDALSCTMLQVSCGENMGSEELYRKCAPAIVCYAASEASVLASATFAKDAYLLENSERVVYAHSGTITLNFGNKVSLGQGHGIVDEDGRYTDRY